VNGLFDSFWRAAAYCLHPRVILWSLAPLLLAGAATALLGRFYYAEAVASVRSLIEAWSLLAALMQWLDSMGAQGLHALIAPLIIVALAVPVIVMVSLLLVAMFMTPAVVSLVAARRFPKLERRQGGGWWQGLAWSIACTLAALAALVLSIPLWFVPPLVLVLPPLIWGWLTYRVFAFDALASHASAAERRELLHRQRWPLLTMGVVCGYLGAAPSLLWVASAATLVLAPFLLIATVWLYTLVFAFAACWFTHFTLAELQRMRAAAIPMPSPTAPDPAVLELLPPP
jgi:hypothetical protein